MTLKTQHPLSGRKQSPEHIARRVAAVAAARSAWSITRKAEYAAKVAAANATRADDVKQRFAKCNVGRSPWNKGKTVPQLSGPNHGMFGKTHSAQTKARLRANAVGKKQSPELVAKRVRGRAGYRHSDDVKRRLRETNIATWRRPEILAKVSGENSPAWLGGKSFEPYPTSWTAALKDRIRARDHYCCRGCGKPDDENGESLCVHHVDYDKSYLAESNLVAVCKSCHGKTNYNRDDWRLFFQRTFRQAI